MKFSVIVPVYNVHDYLRQCLDSIIAQTEPSWECICVDDGSTDGSGEVCEEYAQQDNRFRVIHQTNKGLPAARNSGINVANGDYLCFIDADDAVVPAWLETASKIIERTDADVARLYLRDWYGDDIPSVGLKDGTQIELLKGASEIIHWGWRILSQEAWAVLLFVNRRRLHDFRFTEGMPIHEDAIFALQILPRIETIAAVRYPGYLYRMRTDSIMHSYITVDGMLRYWQELRNAIIEQRDLLTKYGMWHEVVGIFSRLLYSESRGWSLRRNRKERYRFVEMPAYLNILEKEKLLDFNAIKNPWRCVFKFYCRTGHYLPLLLLYHVAIILVRIRSKCLADELS